MYRINQQAIIINDIEALLTMQRFQSLDRYTHKKNRIVHQNHGHYLNYLNIPFEVSVVSLTFFWSITSLKAGQPQPESNLVSEVNNVSLHTTQVYKPASVVLLYLPVKALYKRINDFFSYS